MSNILANNINPRSGTSIDVGGTLQVGSATTIHTTGIDLGSGSIQSHNINSSGTLQVGSATTIHTTGIDLGSGSIQSHNINSTGIITATGGSFSGNVSIGGTLTYEDVTSVDSVGVITARNGLDVSGITTITGTVSVNGNNYPSRGFFSYRNLVINGAMEVAQRGTSGTTNNAYNCCDRISRHSSGVTGTVTDSKEVLSSGDPYDEGFRSFFRVTKTDASTDSANSFLTVKYKFEAGDIATCGWNYKDPSSYITVSFWVRASVTQDYGFNIETHDGTGYLYNKKFSLVANTWKKIVQKVPGLSNLTFVNDNGHGMTLDWRPYLGSTYNTATDGAWDEAGSNKFGDNLGTSWWTSADTTLDITGVQVEVGEVATPFERRPFADQLHACQRYYQKLFYTIHSYPFGSGYTYGTTSTACVVPMASPMRSPTTTVTFNNLLVRGYNQNGVNSSAAVTSITSAQNQETHACMMLNVNHATIPTAAIGAAAVLCNNANGVSSYLAFETEL